jgi:hypothetical protein
LSNAPHYIDEDPQVPRDIGQQVLQATTFSSRDIINNIYGLSSESLVDETQGSTQNCVISESPTLFVAVEQRIIALSRTDSGPPVVRLTLEYVRDVPSYIAVRQHPTGLAM